MQEKSPRHQAALRFAEDGIPVFPCMPMSKDPATEHGFYDATTDIDTINRWWGEADYNLAFQPASVGWAIVDIDDYHPGAREAWAEFEAEHGAIDTYEVRSPRGGRHLYFEGDLPSTASKLAGHIDTRGRGGYALLPPSLNEEGKPYVTVKDTSIVPLPGWITAKLARTDSRLAGVATEVDQPQSLGRARDWLDHLVQRGDLAVEGRGGNYRTYQVCCELHNLGISAGAAQQLIEEVWNPHCLPPWEPAELAQVVENAYAYAQNDPGAWAVAPLSETFASALDQLPAPKTGERRSRFAPRGIIEQLAGKPTDWLIPDLIPERGTVLVLGKSGDFKSFLVQDMVMAVATQNVKTCGVYPKQHGIVFYAAAEGRIDLETKRNRAWMKYHDKSEADLKDFYTLPVPHVVSEAQCAEFREGIRSVLRQGSTRVKAIVLDTVHKGMVGLEENSSKDSGLFVSFCESLEMEFECPIIALHHYGKGGEDAGARGSSALTADFDTTLAVRRIERTLAVELRALQHKDAEERKEPWTFEGLKVENSLVFQLTDPKAHKQFLDASNVFSHAKVASALASLGAIGEDNAVTSDVLASTIIPPGTNRTEEENLDSRDRNARSLAGLGRRELAGYCAKRGREMVWFIASEVSAGVQAAIADAIAKPEGVPF